MGEVVLLDDAWIMREVRWLEAPGSVAGEITWRIEGVAPALPRTTMGPA